MMDRYEYDITSHDAEDFRKVVYFCNESGDCDLEHVPTEEPRALTGLLNERGEQGWELIQLVFGSNGFMAFWKRKIGG